MDKIDRAYMPKAVQTEMIMPNTLETRRELTLHVNRYAIAIPFVKNKVVLDVACGNRYGSHYLTKKLVFQTTSRHCCRAQTGLTLTGK